MTLTEENDTDVGTASDWKVAIWDLGEFNRDYSFMMLEMLMVPLLGGAVRADRPA